MSILWEFELRPIMCKFAAQGARTHRRCRPVRVLWKQQLRKILFQFSIEGASAWIGRQEMPLVRQWKPWHELLQFTNAKPRAISNELPRTGPFKQDREISGGCTQALYYADRRVLTNRSRWGLLR
jgi:hypothetical protein